MFARGLEEAATTALAVFGAISRSDQPLLTQFGARLLDAAPRLGDVVAEQVRAIAAAPRLGTGRKTVIG